MFRLTFFAALLALTSGFTAPVASVFKMGASKLVMQHGGKGFGGGEATRDPEPTVIDPNDPKGKQQAIHKAESFADYLAKRTGGSSPLAAPASMPTPAPPPPAPPAPAASHGGKGFGGGEATRDPEPTVVDPNDPKGKQQAIHQAESFAEYLAKRTSGATSPTALAYVSPPAAPAAASAPAMAPTAAAPPSSATAMEKAMEARGSLAPAPPPKAPDLTDAEKAALKAKAVAEEAAEDAAMPPLPAGGRVELVTPKEWSRGKTGVIRDFDATLNKYYVWLPHEPTGTEPNLEKPLLMLVRRAHLKQI